MISATSSSDGRSSSVKPEGCCISSRAALLVARMAKRSISSEDVPVSDWKESGRRSRRSPSNSLIKYVNNRFYNTTKASCNDEVLFRYLANSAPSRKCSKMRLELYFEIKYHEIFKSSLTASLFATLPPRSWNEFWIMLCLSSLLSAQDVRVEQCFLRFTMIALQGKLLRWRNLRWMKEKSRSSDYAVSFALDDRKAT